MRHGPGTPPDLASEQDFKRAGRSGWADDSHVAGARGLKLITDRKSGRWKRFLDPTFAYGRVGMARQERTQYRYLGNSPALRRLWDITGLWDGLDQDSGGLRVGAKS